MSRSRKEKELLEAIKHLIKHGSRHSECVEAGLLNVIEELLYDPDPDLTSIGLYRLMSKAAKL